jgi:hypothetical protein
MTLIVRVVSVVCGLLAFRGIRWAYVSYVAFALLYFPLQVGFQFSPRACQTAVSIDLAVSSLGNWAHIVLCAIFYVMTIAQFQKKTAAAFLSAAFIVVAMGAAVEALQGLTGSHNCKVRDVIPDTVGAAIGMAVMAAWTRTREFRSMPARF